MTTTEMNTVAPSAAPEPGAIGAGAAIYRRLERRPSGPKWMKALPIAVFALVAAGGVIAYVTMTKPAATPQPAQTAQIASPPAALQVEPATPTDQSAQVAAATPAPVSPAPVRAARHHDAVASAERARAPSAESASENASAYAPAAPAAVAPPPAASLAPPPVVMAAPPPVASAPSAVIAPAPDSASPAPATPPPPAPQM